MDKFIIQGGHRLKGEVQVSGSKNASLPIMAATLLCPGQHVLKNIPHLADTKTMAGLLEHLGVKVTDHADHAIFDSTDLTSSEATYDIVRKMRASVWVLGPLVARLGSGRVSLPGGCAIGARPIDMHLKGLEALGAEIQLHEGYVEAKAPAGGLVGARMMLRMPSVGATHQVMMAATLARGTTVIENAAREPEVVELATALRSMGAKIHGDGGCTITIEGVETLSPLNHEVGPDRIESGTLVALAAATAGDVVIRGVRVDHLEIVLESFAKAGCRYEVWDSERAANRLTTDLKVMGPERLRAVDMQTAVFPGFPTDMQAQFMACMAIAEGTSHIEETIFENRFMHVSELNRLGADISLHGHCAVINGVERLEGAPVMATDLRASASLLIAALRAQGRSEILRIYHLDRGYAALEEKLTALGAKVQRAKE